MHPKKPLKKHPTKMPKKSLHKSLCTNFPKPKKPPQTPLNYQNAPRRTGATLSDVDRYISENFSSLSLSFSSSGGRRDFTAGSTNRDVVVGPADFSPRFTDPPADVIRAATRFFVAPGPTGSLIEEARLSAASAAEAEAEPPEEEDGRTAVVTVSKDPYVDFRRSMQEMVDARHVDPCGPLDWDFLEELLACYLELNERSVHECILRAFMDLTEGLRRRRMEMKWRRKRMDGKFV